MKTEEIGALIKKRRKSLKMNQVDLALVSGTGVRFISDLENGKETCELGRTLKVLENLGMKIDFQPRDQK
jgi:y4mF family transcriptional regulator